MRHWHVIVAIVILAVAPPAARADSWAMPQEAVFKSRDHAFRAVITPRRVTDQLAYFTDLEEEKTPAGQAAGETARTASARVEKRVFLFRWRTVWAGPLVNEVAPVHALVANGGRYLVTFDNWHSVGFGDHIVVIYDASGKLVRSLALEDILPADYIEALPRSVSSLWWSGEHAFSDDGERLILQVVAPSEDESIGGENTVPISIELASGRVIPPSGPEWSAAMATAQPITARRRAYQAAQRAAFIAPLLGPVKGDAEAWSDYLYGAFARLDPAWEDAYPQMIVMQPADSPEEAARSLEDSGIQSAVEEGPPSVILIASTAGPDHLLSALAAKVRPLTAGSLDGVRVYVVAPAAHKDAIAALLAPTQAVLRLLDPAEPIPQRPERLARLRD